LLQQTKHNTWQVAREERTKKIPSPLPPLLPHHLPPRPPKNSSDQQAHHAANTWNLFTCHVYPQHHFQCSKDPTIGPELCHKTSGKPLSHTLSLSLSLSLLFLFTLLCLRFTALSLLVVDPHFTKRDPPHPQIKST